MARAGSVRGPQLAPLLAVSNRDQHLPRSDWPPVQAGTADRLRPGRRSTRRPRRAGCGVGLDGALPRRAAGRRGRARRARSELRAAGERGAGVHHRASTPAGEAARRVDSARGARLLRRRGGADARDDDRGREQRAPASPRDCRCAAAEAKPAGNAALTGRRWAARGRGRLRRCLGARRCRRGGGDADRGRRPRDAAACHLVSGPRGDLDLPVRVADVGGVALASRTGARERAGRIRVLLLGPRRGGLRPIRTRGADARRRADRGHHRLRGASHARPRARDLRPLDRAAARSAEGRRRLRALRAARTG